MEFEYQESKMTIVTMTIMTTIEANKSSQFYIIYG